MQDEWPFEDPPNVAVLTLWDILEGTAPILRVCHDADEGGGSSWTAGLCPRKVLPSWD